jgi:hypothetical protein
LQQPSKKRTHEVFILILFYGFFFFRLKINFYFFADDHFKKIDVTEKNVKITRFKSFEMMQYQPIEHGYRIP